MTWTKTPPTKPGAYWWRQNTKDNEPILAIVDSSEDWDGELIDVSSDMLPKDVGGEWCGPLVPAIELEKAFAEGFKFAHLSTERIDECWDASRARKISEGQNI